MGTYRTVYTQKIYNDLFNFLNGKSRKDSFECVSNMKFQYLEGKVGYPTEYDMLRILTNEKIIVQLTTYGKEEENPFFEEIMKVSFDGWITIFTTEGTIIEIVSTKKMEKEFADIGLKFKE